MELLWVKARTNGTFPTAHTGLACNTRAEENIFNIEQAQKQKEPGKAQMQKELEEAPKQKQLGGEKSKNLGGDQQKKAKATEKAVEVQPPRAASVAVAERKASNPKLNGAKTDAGVTAKRPSLFSTTPRSQASQAEAEKVEGAVDPKVLTTGLWVSGSLSNTVNAQSV